MGLLQRMREAREKEQQELLEEVSKQESQDEAQTEDSHKEDSQEQEQEQEEKFDFNVWDRLKGFLHDDFLVQELLPVFESLEGNPHAEKIFEIIESKQQELDSVLSNPEVFEQDTNPDDVKGLPDKEEDADETDYVYQILTEKYGE